RIGRATIAMELRRHERALANDLPLLSLAGELGYHDVETLLLAVADHIERADLIVTRLIEQVDNAALSDDQLEIPEGQPAAGFEGSDEPADTTAGSATSTSAAAGRP